MSLEPCSLWFAAPVDSDRARFEAEVLLYLDAAYRLARWLMKSPSDADDVVQDSVLRAFRGFASLRGSDAKAWLLAIVRNSYWTMARKQRGCVPLLDVGDESLGLFSAAEVTPESAAFQAEAGRALDQEARSRAARQARLHRRAIAQAIVHPSLP